MKDKQKEQIIIGFHGVARSGKDTAAGFLTEAYGFTRVAFADKLRKFCYNLNPHILVPFDHFYRDDIFPNISTIFKKTYLTRRTYRGYLLRLQELVDALGWELAKSIPEVRETLQRAGKDAGRDVIGENVWINAAMAEADNLERVVFTDVRFDNEAITIRRRGGIIIRIDRPGFEPVNSHVSDAGISDDFIDAEICNGGTIHELKAQVNEKVHKFIKDKFFLPDSYT